MRSASKAIFLTVVPTVLGITLSTPMNSSADALPILLPFHAVIHGTANPFPIDACTLGNHETASGRAVHLGTITWSSDEIARFLSCSPPSPPGPAIAVSGKFKMLAANGDEIDGEYQTTGIFDPVQGVSVQRGYTLVSGTGRFRNVNGSGVIAAEGAAGPPFDFIASLNGTISNIGH